jgi:hypothetical protein
MAIFPSGIKTWVNKTNGVDTVSASHVNEAYEEIIALENHVLNTRTFGDLTGGNTFEVQSDGTPKLNGNATVWVDLLPSSVTIGGGGNAPAFTAYGGGNLRAYEFVGTGAQLKELNIGFQIPHEYKEGSTIIPHLHLYIPNDVSGGTVKFYCEYEWSNISQIGAITPTTVSGTAIVAGSFGIQNNAILSFGNVSGAGKTISSVFMCRIYRDPADVSDTFGASVWLKSADIHVELDGIGSKTSTSK